jgi:hypothetical protein
MWHHIIIHCHFHQGRSAYDRILSILLCSSLVYVYSVLLSLYVFLHFLHFVPGLTVVIYLASLFLKLTEESFFLFTTTVHTNFSLILSTFFYCASDFKYNVLSCSVILLYIYCYSMWRRLFWRKFMICTHACSDFCCNSQTVNVEDSLLCVSMDMKFKDTTISQSIHYLETSILMQKVYCNSRNYFFYTSCQNLVWIQLVTLGTIKHSKHYS